jgi:DNA-binding NtrC family response regulator
MDATGRRVLTDSAIRILQKHQFVGNIRELRNILARALVLANTHVIDGKVIRSCLEIDQRPVAPQQHLTDLKTNEMLYLDRILAHCAGDKEKAAAMAGISVRSLYRKLETLGQA